MTNSLGVSKEIPVQVLRSLTQKQPLSMIAVLGIAAATDIGFILYLQFGLGFDFFRSDVFAYWQMSMQPLQPFSSWFMPGYPWAIALARFMMADFFSPPVIMQCIAGASMLVSVSGVYLLARGLEIDNPEKWALLFAWYPFIGLTYTASPIADNMAIALLVLAIVSFQRKAWTGFALASAAMLVTHKATWFFALPLFTFAFINHPESRARVVLAGIPLILFLLGGAVYSQDFFWFARWSMNKLMSSRSPLPAFDGVVGTLLAGELRHVVKGVIVAACFSLALALFIASWKRRLWLVIAVTMGFLIMGAIVNQYEIWVLVRYSKLLVVCAVVGQFSILQTRAEEARPLLDVLLLGSVVSNLAYGYYMAKVFFS